VPRRAIPSVAGGKQAATPKVQELLKKSVSNTAPGTTSAQDSETGQGESLQLSRNVPIMKARPLGVSIWRVAFTGDDHRIDLKSAHCLRTLYPHRALSVTSDQPRVH